MKPSNRGALAEPLLPRLIDAVDAYLIAPLAEILRPPVGDIDFERDLAADRLIFCRGDALFVYLLRLHDFHFITKEDFYDGRC